MTTQPENDIYKFFQPVNQWPKYSGYQYLSEADSEIRLLRISFAPGSHTVSVNIIHASLHDRDLAYAALSYRWGPPDRLRPILIDGEEVHIRGSLHAFLTALCERELTYLVWLDSLCINQQDSNERNWQVRMMGGIYTNALHVHVWLGEATPDSDYFLSYLQHRNDPSLASSPYLVEHRIKAQNALPDVVQRPYWNRLWIIQEISLATEVFVWCGERRLVWTDFLDGIESLKTPEHDRILQAINEISTSRVAAPMGSIRFSQLSMNSTSPGTDSRRGSISLKLVDLVKQFKDHKCEDDRDRIYGLVSIAADGAKVEIDYHKTIAEVMIDLVNINYPVLQSGVGLRMLPLKVKELWDYLSLEDTRSFFSTTILHDSLQFRSEFTKFLNTRQLISSFLLPWSRKYLQGGIGDQMLDSGSIFLPSQFGDWPDIDDLLFRCELHPSKARIVPGSMLAVLRLEKSSPARFRVVGCVSSLRLAPHFLSDQSLQSFKVRDQIQICTNILPPNVVEDYSYVEFERYLQMYVHHNKAFLMSAVGETCGKPLLDPTPTESLADLMRDLPLDQLRLNVCNCASRDPSIEAVKSFRQEVSRESISGAELKLIKKACDKRRVLFAQRCPSQFVPEDKGRMDELKSDFKRAFAWHHRD